MQSISGAHALHLRQKIGTKGLKAGGLFAPASREGGLVLNNILLTAAAATVLLGTLYPLLAEAGGRGGALRPPRGVEPRVAVLLLDVNRDLISLQAPCGCRTYLPLSALLGRLQEAIQHANHDGKVH